MRRIGECSRFCAREPELVTKRPGRTPVSLVEVEFRGWMTRQFPPRFRSAVCTFCLTSSPRGQRRHRKHVRSSAPRSLRSEGSAPVGRTSPRQRRGTGNQLAVVPVPRNRAACRKGARPRPCRGQSAAVCAPRVMSIPYARAPRQPGPGSLVQFYSLAACQSRAALGWRRVRARASREGNAARRVQPLAAARAAALAYWHTWYSQPLGLRRRWCLTRASPSYPSSPPLRTRAHRACKRRSACRHAENSWSATRTSASRCISRRGGGVSRKLLSLVSPSLVSPPALRRVSYNTSVHLTVAR